MEEKTGAGAEPGPNGFVRFAPKSAIFDFWSSKSGTHRLTNAEVAEILRGRPAMRASLACEGLYLPDEIEASFDQLEAERLPPDEAVARIIEFHRVKRLTKALAAECLDSLIC